MGNVLKVEKIQQIQTLAKLGWSIRRISRELTVDRGTVSKYRLVVQNPPKVPTDSGPPDAENPPKVPTDLRINRGTLFPYFLIGIRRFAQGP
jgi:hypothetical protein